MGFINGGGGSAISTLTIDKNLDLGAFLLKSDHITESTAAHGVTLDTVLKSDHIAEKTTSHGTVSDTTLKNALSQAFGTLSYASGNYTGDGSQNRAIAHGLSVVPKIILVFQFDWEYSIWIQVPDVDNTRWTLINTNSYTDLTVTATTSTNFYVGGVGATFYSNNNGKAYKWIALW